MNETPTQIWTFKVMTVTFCTILIATAAAFIYRIIIDGNNAVSDDIATKLLGLVIGGFGSLVATVIAVMRGTPSAIPLPGGTIQTADAPARSDVRNTIGQTIQPQTLKSDAHIPETLLCSTPQEV